MATHDPNHTALFWVVVKVALAFLIVGGVLGWVLA